MKRLIDAERLKTCYTGTNGLDDKAEYAAIRKMIDLQPTVCEIDDAGNVRICCIDGNGSVVSGHKKGRGDK